MSVSQLAQSAGRAWGCSVEAGRQSPALKRMESQRNGVSAVALEDQGTRAMPCASIWIISATELLAIWLGRGCAMSRGGCRIRWLLDPHHGAGTLRRCGRRIGSADADRCRTGSAARPRRCSECHAQPAACDRPRRGPAGSRWLHSTQLLAAAPALQARRVKAATWIGNRRWDLTLRQSGEDAGPARRT